MINADSIKLMRDGATILNFARDGIVNDEAVIGAIKEGKIHAYVCDFPSNTLKGQDRVIALPHLGASTGEAEENCAVMVAEQVKDFLLHGNIKNSVNFPEVNVPQETEYRVVVANENVPKMLGSISTVMADAGLNIHDMVNKSRGDLAYTVVDCDSEISDAVIDKLSRIEGVLSVRAIQ
jgi:D-3-phosphoglycerate dehydrogenase